MLCAGAIPYFNSHFGSGSGPIILDRVTCSRQESNILECLHGGIGVVSSSCNRYNQVGIQCISKCHDVYTTVILVLRTCSQGL